MRSKIQFKLLLSLFIIVGVVLFSIVFLFSSFDLRNKNSYAKNDLPIDNQNPQKLPESKTIEPILAAAVPEQINFGLPIRLKIPIIKVDAAIESVGITSQGAMGTPKIPRDAGWFKFGPRPGEVGSAAIAGHVDWWNGATAVFANLKKLKTGDKIVIQDDKGKNISFIVRESRSYGSGEDVANIFCAHDGKAHLNLITCGGVWNNGTKQYSKRLVVFADKE